MTAAKRLWLLFAGGLVLYVLLSAFASSCARADEWRPPTRGETALFAAAELLIAVDVVQTHDFLRHPGPEHLYEVNPLLGEHPSDALIIATGAGAMLATAAAWYFLPPPWRNLPTMVVVFVEVPNVTHNAIIGARIRW